MGGHRRAGGRDRVMPALAGFFKEVLAITEKLRLYSTIQAKLEGELVLHLDRARGIRVIRRTMKAFTESILQSAELAPINCKPCTLCLVKASL